MVRRRKRTVKKRRKQCGGSLVAGGYFGSLTDGLGQYRNFTGKNVKPLKGRKKSSSTRRIKYWWQRPPLL